MVAYLAWCPACNSNHPYWVRHYVDRPQGPLWTMTGDMNSPTFRASMLVTRPPGYVCHSFVTDGVMEYCPDCTHGLKGTRRPLDPVD